MNHTPPPKQSTAALKRARARRLARLGGRVYALRRRGREQEMYNLICDEFAAMGGVYVKFLQGVLFSTPVMKRWHNPNRLRIFEDLDHIKLDVVQTLRDELSPEQLAQIALVQPEPFAAGSFGQVYLAQHVDGTRVVIKVLRPMIRELLKFDLRLLSIFSKRFAAKEYTNLTVNMDAALKEFRDATLSETDYVSEAKFADELYETYKNHPTMVIPRTYLELCTPRIIVQEFLDGLSGAQILRAREQGHDPRAYVRDQIGSDLTVQLQTLGVETLLGAFGMPRVQGDPHPGNIRFLPENKVGMIDFGIAAAAPRNKPAFYGILSEWHGMYGDAPNVAGMFEQFMRFFVNDLYRALKKLSTLLPQAQLSGAAHEFIGTPNPQSHDLMKEVGRIVQQIFDSTTGASDLQAILRDGRMLQAFGQMVNKNNRLGLIVRLESSEILRAAQTYISFLDALGMRLELLPKILGEAVARVEREYPDIVNQSESVVSMSQAINTVNHWLERVALKDPALFSQLLQRINAGPAGDQIARPTVAMPESAEPLDTGDIQPESMLNEAQKTNQES